MNYTQTFEEFSKGLSSTDLALYAGIGLVLWVLFKDKLSPVQQLIVNTIDKFKKTPNKQSTNLSFTNILDSSSTKKDVFFKLIESWKRTRDLAVESGCVEAVKVADQMFPFLSPQGCNEGKNNV